MVAALENWLVKESVETDTVTPVSAVVGSDEVPLAWDSEPVLVCSELTMVSVGEEAGITVLLPPVLTPDE